MAAVGMTAVQDIRQEVTATAGLPVLQNITKVRLAVVKTAVKRDQKMGGEMKAMGRLIDAPNQSRSQERLSLIIKSQTVVLIIDPALTDLA
jgi:hypothetical protein